MNIVHTPNHYLIILDGVPHGELIPLHLPSFSAFIRPLEKIAMIDLYVLGYFNRNKQNSYAALNISKDHLFDHTFSDHANVHDTLFRTPRSNHLLIHNMCNIAWKKYLLNTFLILYVNKIEYFFAKLKYLELYLKK